MRKLTTSLSLVVFLAPLTAFAQGEGELAPAEQPPTEGPTPTETPMEEAAAEPEVPAPAVNTTSSTDAAAQAQTATAATTSATTPAAPLPPATAAEGAPSAPKRAPTTRGGGDGGTDKWELSYSGYFRAPMRLGISDNTGPQHMHEAREESGNPNANPDGLPLVHDADGNWVNGQYVDKRMVMHRPVIPDDQYASWQFTGHNKNAWAEMFFGVGNSVVTGYLAIQAFQFTDSSWKMDNTQFGIGQGWVEVDHDLGFENVKFNAKVGSHWARYGMAGMYDAGEYDTYIIGRTHLMGGTARLDFILPTFDLGVEGGFGVNEPNPKMFNRARFTLAGHGHVFFKLPSMEFGLHAMHAWANASTTPSYPNVQPGSSGCAWDTYPGAQCTISDDQIARADGTELAGGVDGVEGQMSVWGAEYPVGTQTILGVDGRFDLGLLGYFYLGASHQMLKNALTIGDAIESIHSLGAGEFAIGVVDNYLESPFCVKDAPNESCSNGTGTVTSALAQYELGLANFGIFPGSMDLRAKLYGMLNYVTVSDVEEYRLQQIYGASANVTDLRQDGTMKYKYGIDLEFFPLEWMSAGLRFDRLNPTNNKFLRSYQGFMVLSPRITFRTKMVTHEQISLSYSRYFYDQRVCEDSGGAVASPADDPFRAGDGTNHGSIYNTTSADYPGLPLRVFCTQPPKAPAPPTGFGSHSNTQDPGLRGAASLLPDENVVKLEASMWW